MTAASRKSSRVVGIFLANRPTKGEVRVSVRDKDSLGKGTTLYRGNHALEAIADLVRNYRKKFDVHVYLEKRRPFTLKQIKLMGVTE